MRTPKTAQCGPTGMHVQWLTHCGSWHSCDSSSPLFGNKGHFTFLLPHYACTALLDLITYYCEDQMKFKLFWARGSAKLCTNVISY